MFQITSPIHFHTDPFAALTDNVNFEALGRGRMGAIMVLPDQQHRVPMVRTTTPFHNAAQHFTAACAKLAQDLHRTISTKIAHIVPEFNNVCLELYTTEYRKMRFHTDQSLDLKKESYICLYTCYRDPKSDAVWTLVIQDKKTGLERSLTLQHDTFVFFSTGTNSTYRHKIVSYCHGHDNVWLGATFRTSETFVSFRESIPYMPNGAKLRLATQPEATQFHRWKGEENSSTEQYLYPCDLNYTLSPSDLKPMDSDTHPMYLPGEARLNFDRHWLVLMCETSRPELEFAMRHFPGHVSKEPRFLAGETVYFGGDLSVVDHSTMTPEKLFVIRDISTNFDETKCTVVDLVQVPMNVHGVGILYRNFFGSQSDLFDRITTAHKFQSLTESDKPGTALRTGLYLTNVQETETSDISFRLLRCSSNFTGPTEGLADVDRDILRRVNEVASDHFDGQAELNHVLAQIYHNDPLKGKATIKSHSDKTKDMPEHGVMAFCTFYDNRGLKDLQPSTSDSEDRCHKGVSAFPRLLFRLKADKQAQEFWKLPVQFEFRLYPNSVFLMPLSTNRLYTHEIRTSALPAEYLPTRMGYVIRCSKTEALFKDSQTFIKRGENFVPLRHPSPTEVQSLKDLYRLENTTVNRIMYGDIDFSLNKGDFMRPVFLKE